jgi:hypothetical protein
MQDQILVLTSSGAVWRSGSVGVGGLGHAVPTSETWSLKNSWKMLPLPEPVLAMRGFTTLTGTEDGVQFLTSARGVIGYGNPQAFKTNAAYNVSNVGYKELAELRSFDIGVAVTNPLKQTI